jgi:hypothetical protein
MFNTVGAAYWDHWICLSIGWCDKIYPEWQHPNGSTWFTYCYYLIYLCPDVIIHFIIHFIIHSVSQIFAAIMFVDDCGTKNPYQNSLSLWQRQNWKPVKILGWEINFEAIGSPKQAKVYGAPSNWWRFKFWLLQFKT